MASSQQHRGYDCDFIDIIPDELRCKACNLIARKLTLTSCCGESYCHACLTDLSDQSNPCPACGERDFTVFSHRKNQKKINSLQVYCSLKERGCGWSGPLEQLDTHLDPNQDNCQYVDTKCPLNCHIDIPKNKVEQHVAEECFKRPYVCKHCNFKATYEEVVNTHIPECKYVPLDCPNRCTVTCDREHMEDHMKICRLEVIACHFKGCNSKFKREDLEEHSKQNSEKHLALTASLVSKVEKNLYANLEDQNKVLKEQEERLLSQEKIMKQIIIDQGRKLQQMEMELALRALKSEYSKQAQLFEQKLQELEKKLLSQNGEYKAQNNELKEHEKKLLCHDKERKVENDRLLQLEDQVRKTHTQSMEHKNEELKLKHIIDDQTKTQENHFKEMKKHLEEVEEQVKHIIKQFQVFSSQTEAKFFKLSSQVLPAQEEKLRVVEQSLEVRLSSGLQNVEQVRVLSSQNKAGLFQLSNQVLPAQEEQLRVVKHSLEERLSSGLQSVEQVRVLSGQNEAKLSKLFELVIPRRKFSWEQFSELMRTNEPVCSPPMFTHIGGYKFCIGVTANGHGEGYVQCMNVYVYAMPGEYDDILKWPVQVNLSVELVNQRGGKNFVASENALWSRVEQVQMVTPFRDAIPIAALCDFLSNDTLCFIVSLTNCYVG